MKLSIIVPVYGVANYLCKCLDSLLAQDITDYEIILVDDGSPDECPQICDEYVEQYTNIKAIHQENMGLSEARNTGTRAAQGEYIMYVDSDDYIEPNVLGKLIEQVERYNLDVLRFNYQNINEQYEVFMPFKDAKRDVDYSEDVVDGETFLNKRLGPACYAVMFIVRRDLLDACLFTPNIYFEDTDWTPRMLSRAQRVASTPMVVYNYLWRQGSITLPTEPQKREKVLRDKMSLLYGFRKQMQLVRDPIWFAWMTSFNTMTILNMLAALPTYERKPYLQELKSLCVFPLYTKREKGIKRFKIQMANFSPALYCALMNLRYK